MHVYASARLSSLIGCFNQMLKASDDPPKFLKCCNEFYTNLLKKRCFKAFSPVAGLARGVIDVSLSVALIFDTPPASPPVMATSIPSGQH